MGDAPQYQKRRLDWLAMPLVVVWVFSNTARFASFARETQHFDDVLAAMEPGKRAAALYRRSKHAVVRDALLISDFASWYQAQKAGIVDFNFADFRLVLRRKDMAEPRVGEQLAWYPGFFDWNLNGGARYDYFIVKADGDLAATLQRPPGLGQAREA